MVNKMKRPWPTKPCHKQKYLIIFITKKLNRT
jgi:hypothetical protein